ncbi:MAG TPA: sodium ion-translocating decarboxylase subunit beta [Dehalococcoidia bacterium]|nr:sodium ion-translocating decarboxylase subunit beta [Dehalococcoidia bacterium]
MLDRIWEFLNTTGFAGLYWGNVVMLVVGGVLIYLAIKKKYEPLLLLPIGFGVILANLPGTGLMEEGGLLNYLGLGVHLAIFPPLIFLGIGALTDFSPLLANPKTFFLGAAAQFGIFAAFFLALAWGFPMNEAGSIGIIGGADGPTAIYTTVMLAPDKPELLGIIAIAAYSYMALVPIIQPPIMRLLTNKRERAIVMEDTREVSRLELILFPIIITVIVVLLLPKAAPLIGMLMFGNLLRECGVTERLHKTAGNELINIITIFLCIVVGAEMAANKVLTPDTLKIFLLGLFAFGFGTASGVLMGKLMCWLTGGKVNPLIGAAGVSAVPMAARVVQVEGQRANPQNFLLLHAMGPNVAGVIGSATVAGLLIAFLA